MERKESVRLPAGTARSLPRIPARRHHPPRLPRSRRQVRGRRRDRRWRSSRASSRTTRGPSRCRRTTSASRPSYETVPSPRGQRHDQGLLRAAGERQRQAARGPRHPREPRPESVYRGRRAALRGRQLHRVRARRPDLGRRLSRRREKGAAAFRNGGRPEDDRRLRGGRQLAEGASGIERQDRRRRLLLRRRHREQLAVRLGPDLRRGGAVLRPAAERRGHGEDQGAARCCTTPATIQGIDARHPGVRGGAQGEQQDLQTSTSTKARSTASTTTRRRATTRQRPSSPGRARSTVQQESQVNHERSGGPDLLTSRCESP